ncbi:MAG: immunoglobulin domain-containing protein, partial [Limisphaerales bacterium]
DESSGGDGSASWRWKAYRVSGAGNQTQLWIGGGTWRASHQPQLLETTDNGLTFQPIARMDDRDNGGQKGSYALGGQPSSITSTPADSARPGLKVSYQGHYPGSGWTARPNRYTMNPQGDGTAPWQGGTGRPGFFDRDEAGSDTFPAFRWEAAGKDGIPINHAVDGVEHYDGNWVLTMDAQDGLEYIVSYAIPSWNQQFGAVGNADAIFKPGWIGVHTLDGLIASGASAYKIPVYETDEPIVDPNGNGGTGHDYVYEGDITVYPVAGAGANTGKSLVLWSGGSSGFGVFQVENTPAVIVSGPSATEVSENREVTLSATVSGSPNKYQWTRNGVDLVVTNANYRMTLTEGANKATLTILEAQVADSGSYVLKIQNPLGNLETTPVTLTVVSDSTPPTLGSVQAGKSPSTSYLTVEFSEPVTPETASVAANYRLSGGATVTGVTLAGPSGVALTTSALTSGTEYTLTVSGIRDASAAGNLIAANSTATVPVPGLTSGYLLWELYNGTDGAGIPGTAVDALYNDASFPDFAARRELLTSFTTAPALNNVADNFGGRISGWLTPTESGSYRFFVRSDDASQLYVSSNADAASAVLAAEEFGCCNAFLEPTNADGNINTQTSEPIALVAGTSYLVYAVYKEGGGGDFCEVAWRKEGDATPAAQLTPIPGSFFKSYAAVAPMFNPVEVTAGGVVISWTGAGRLQESGNLTTWTDVAGNPASPYTVSTAGGGIRFYRLAQ